MYVTPILLALVSLGQVSETPAWSLDYSQARQQAATQQKPLAVFLGTGDKGWEQVVRGGLNQDVRSLLSAKFICVYIDTASTQGKSWADAFEITGGQGLVLSDRTAANQAFWRQGSVDGRELAQQLERLTTRSRTSLYPSGATPTSVLGVVNGSSTGSIMQSGSSYCPCPAAKAAAGAVGELQLFIGL